MGVYPAAAALRVGDAVAMSRTLTQCEEAWTDEWNKRICGASVTDVDAPLTTISFEEGGCQWAAVNFEAKQVGEAFIAKHGSLTSCSAHRRPSSIVIVMSWRVLVVAMLVS